MSLRIRYHVKASRVLKRAINLFIHNYLRSLLNNVRLLIVRTRLEPASYYLCVWRFSRLNHKGTYNIYIYIYIYIYIIIIHYKQYNTHTSNGLHYKYRNCNELHNKPLRPGYVATLLGVYGLME